MRASSICPLGAQLFSPAIRDPSAACPTCFHHGAGHGLEHCAPRLDDPDGDTERKHRLQAAEWHAHHQRASLQRGEGGEE